MLILTRKVGEAIAIDEHITIRVLDIKGGQVRLGIVAPAEVSVHREEVLSRIMEVNRQAAVQAASDLEQLDRLLESGGGPEGKKGG